jgi:hypothetical protein
LNDWPLNDAQFMPAITACLAAITFVLLIALLKTRVRRAEFARLQQDIKQTSEEPAAYLSGRATTTASRRRPRKPATPRPFVRPPPGRGTTVVRGECYHPAGGTGWSNRRQGFRPWRGCGKGEMHALRSRAFMLVSTSAVAPRAGLGPHRYERQQIGLLYRSPCRL